jgi:hypothetical protein
MPLKSGSAHSISAMHQFSSQKNANQIQEIEKVPFVVAKKIREAILDEVFKPGDHLTEAELAEKFEAVNRLIFGSVWVSVTCIDLVVSDLIGRLGWLRWSKPRDIGL